MYIMHATMPQRNLKLTKLHYDLQSLCKKLTSEGFLASIPFQSLGFHDDHRQSLCRWKITHWEHEFAEFGRSLQKPRNVKKLVHKYIKLIILKTWGFLYFNYLRIPKCCSQFSPVESSALVIFNLCSVKCKSNWISPVRFNLVERTNTPNFSSFRSFLALSHNLLACHKIQSFWNSRLMTYI